jgi:regulator of protease activity HflC (stomatin/prohibitin superfamily)
MSYRKSLPVVVCLLFAGCGYTSTNPGEGVVFARFGQVEEKCYPAGFYFYNPFTTSVYHVDLKVQALRVEKAAAVSHNLQEIHTDMVLNFSIDPQNCHVLIKTVGNDYANRLIIPAILEILKASTANFAIEKVIQERPKLKDEIVKGLKGRLAPYWINAHDLALTNFSFSPEFARAVELKQVEEQNVAKAEFIRQQQIKKGEGELAFAEGQAKANLLLQNSLKASPELLQMKGLDKWDGHLPVVTGGSIPFIDVKSLTGKP